MSENKVIWHPIEEGYPPEVDGVLSCLVTFKSGDIDIIAYTDDLYERDNYDFSYYKNLPKEERKGFFMYDTEYGAFEHDDIIAWAYLPEPYEDTQINEEY